MADPNVLDIEKINAWGPIIVGLVAVLASSIANFCLIKSQRHQNSEHNSQMRENLRLRRSEDEREEINRKLKDFYGPLKQLRIESRILYGKFVKDLKNEHPYVSRRFWTLSYLIKNKDKEDLGLKSHERSLLNQIVSIGKQSLALIENESGVVSLPELRELLGQWGAHIRFLNLAFQRKLSPPAEAYDDILYPRAIDGALESAILRLENRSNALLGKGNAELIKSADGYQKGKYTSIAYYDQHAEQYRLRTENIDLETLYNEFKEVLPRGARILDAGCGTGRDTRYFIENGFIVISFDASSEMVELCREYPHAYCLHRSFKEITFHEEFDGVWALASLHHEPIIEAKEAVKNLEKALKPGGFMFISLKYGDGTNDPVKDQGRYFQYYNENTVKELYQDNTLLQLQKWDKSPPKDPQDTTGKNWLNLLLKKRSRLDEK